MSNEAVLSILIFTIFAFSLWIGVGIYLIMKRLDRIEQILTFWKRKQEGWMLLPEPPPERKTAHWVFGNTMGHSWMKCSKCCVSQNGQTGCWTYCPNCGAEMKGETEVEID